MILGMSLPTFTLLHVIISLIAILAGLVTLFAMWSARKPAGWTGLFLLMTFLTCATGFLFPFTKVLPSHITGVICLAVLAVAVYALYSRKLASSWRLIYVVTATIALYLNVFVLVVQGFLKVPALKQLAPTQTEPAFVIAHALVLALFVVFGVVAAKRFHPAAPLPTPATP
jgi:hypothetical protein